MNKITWTAIVLLAAFGTAAHGQRLSGYGAQGPAATPRPPNIVLILADDLGYKDCGFTGSDFYETPNIDRLAQRGMVFNNAYAAAGNCAPSRACLMSGQYTPRHGVYAVTSTNRGPRAMMRMNPVPNRQDLAPEKITMAEALRSAGYATALMGKWHLQHGAGTSPRDQGFDEYVDVRPSQPGRTEDPKGIFTLTRAAMAFMEKNRERPFFLYLAHHAIHTTLESRPASLARFKAKKPGAQHTDPLYAACTYDLDDGVGMLLRKLAELGLEENTLLVFTSDNGGINKSPQEPLRGNKGCYYEGGIREPFIAVWPGHIAAGAHSDVPIINVDLYPTFLAAAGGSAPQGQEMDGETLMPLFTGRATALARPALFWHFPGYLNNPVLRGRDPVFRSRPVTAMREGDWKILLYHEEWQLDGGRERVATNHAVEVYNLAADPGERNDLALKEPAKRDELLTHLLAWIERTGAKLPTEPNPKYDPKAKPGPRQGPEVNDE